MTGLLLILGSLDMPDTGDPASPPSLHVSPRYIEQGFEETGVPNMVTAVLADYRSFDTLGEVGGRLRRGRCLSVSSSERDGRTSRDFAQRDGPVMGRPREQVSRGERIPETCPTKS